MQRSGVKLHVRCRRDVPREIAELGRQWRHGQLVVVAARFLVAIRLAVPVSAEAQHADVHLAATADDRHVTRHRAVDQRAARFDHGALLREGEMSFEMKGPGSEFHQHVRYHCASMKRLGIAAAVAWLAFARPASAHPIPFSYLDLRVQPDAIEGTLIAHIYDVAHDLNVQPIERLLDPAVVVYVQHNDCQDPVERARNRRGRTRADGDLVGARDRRGSAIAAAARPLHASIAHRVRSRLPRRSFRTIPLTRPS